MDVWVTQAGSGQFHNLTRGSARDIVNPSVRTLGFSPDGSRGHVLGPQARRLERRQHQRLGRAHPGWRADGHTSKAWPSTTGRPTAPGSPITRPDRETLCSFRTALRDPATGPSSPRLPASTLTFPCGRRDAAFLYFVQGELPDKLDIWRIPSAGGIPERITYHNARVSHPVLLDRRTLMYLASDADGSGPFLYSMDVERRIPHRLTSGLDRYTSLAASADGRRLLLSVANPKTTLWRLQIADSPAEASAATPIPLTTSTGFSPGLGPNYLLYLSRTGTGENIWKLANGTSTQLWSGQGARVIGGPTSLARWTKCDLLGQPTRANTLVRDALRRYERPHCRRFTQAPRSSRLGA